MVTLFWNSIGMNQTDIGLTQMMFTIVIFALDIPMGYIADRFNRKVLNVVGDLGVAITFVVYAFAQNMYMAILSECLLGLFMAMTNGVDQSFIKYNCNKIDPSGDLFRKTNIRVHTARYISLLVVVVLGGFIAKISLRLTLGMSFFPYFIGGIIAIGIKDFDNKVEVKHHNPIKDMAINVKEFVKDSKVRTFLFSYILGKELTHSQIWVFTPLLVMVGVPMEIVSFGWVINYAMQIVGSKLSEKTIIFKTSNKFAIPVIIEMLWMTILVLNTNIVTVWLFGLNGFVHGLIEGSMVTPLQESTKDEVQTSVLSVASTGARILYIPLVYIVNYLGNIKLQLALVGVIIVFLPMTLLAYKQIKKIEKVNQIKTLGDGINKE
ncbi:MAG: MFS transporter [Clostridia bacterium]|nr:MFS transporter [Clostridia bacterium]